MSHAKKYGISNKQKGLLHIIKDRNHLSDEEYQEILHEASGVESSRDLDSAGFQSVLDLMAELGYFHPRATENYAHRRGRATPGQMAYIDGLRVKVFKSELKSFRRWLEHYYKVTDASFLSQENASRVIEGLKAMGRRNGHE